MKKERTANQQIKYILSVISPPLIGKLSQTIGEQRARKRLRRCAFKLYRNYYTKKRDTRPESYTVLPAEELFLQLTFYQLQALL